MSFNQGEDEPSSDRLLLISMVGIVVLIALAFGYSFLNRRQQLPGVQPPAPPIEQPMQNAPVVVQNGGPIPAPLAPQQNEERIQQPYYAPEPAYTPPPQPIHTSTIRTTGNRKLDGLSGAVTDLN